MMTDLENEAEELEDGTYMTSIPRDVFVAYSSKDMDKVNEMVAYLEENDQSCFCALRNLRHGKGSVENYEHAIEDAMKHCRVFLLLSSENSRSLRCETLKHEIPYLLDNIPNVHRIHSRLDDGITKPGAQVLLREFDNGQEWCRTKEDLIERLIAAKRKKAADRVCSNAKIRRVKIVGGLDFDKVPYGIYRIMRERKRGNVHLPDRKLAAVFKTEENVVINTEITGDFFSCHLICIHGKIILFQ
jgi:hypothetical protein